MPVYLTAVAEPQRLPDQRVWSKGALRRRAPPGTEWFATTVGPAPGCQALKALKGFILPQIQAG